MSSLSLNETLDHNICHQAAKRFLKVYFTIISENPLKLVHLYNDYSRSTRADGEQVQYFQGSNDIRRMVGGLKPLVQVTVVNAQFQPSFGNSILIVVTGLIQFEGEQQRNFIHTFILYPQESKIFILNDLFQYASGATIADSTTPQLPSSSPSIPSQATEIVVDLVEKTTASEPVYEEPAKAPVESPKPADPIPTPEQPKPQAVVAEASPVEEKSKESDEIAPVETSKSLEDVAEAKVVEPPKPMSWASLIAQGPTAVGSNPVIKAPSAAVATVTSPEPKKIDPAVVNPTNTKILSLSNIPQKSDPNIIKNALKNYGEVISVRFISSTKATVEFSTTTGATNLLADSSPVINGNAITVEAGSFQKSTNYVERGKDQNRRGGNPTPRGGSNQTTYNKNDRGGKPRGRF